MCYFLEAVILFTIYILSVIFELINLVNILVIIYIVNKSYKLKYL
jgi:hypothetical protein